MQLADLSGIRPLFLNKQAHKSHVLQHRKKGFASRANPFNLQIISYIYFQILLFQFKSSIAACAAAKRAMGTRNGEQLT